MEHEIIDIFFKLVKSHVEILRQGVDVLIFLSQHHDLTKEQLGLLWDGSVVRC